MLFTGTARDGIWKTRNGGQTWRNTLPNRQTIYSLCVSAAKLIIAGGTGKIYFSTTLGETWDSVRLDTPYPIMQVLEDQRGGFLALTFYEDADTPPIGDGIFYSYKDIQRWQPRNTGLPVHAACEQIAKDRHGRLYLGVTDVNSSGQGGLFVSDDSGLSWSHRAVSLQDTPGAGSYPVRPEFTYGITITAEDSILYSYIGLGPNFGVYTNSVKHIDAVDTATPWKTSSISAAVRTAVHMAHNGDYYTSVVGMQSGGTMHATDGGQTWKIHREGLGNTASGVSTRQFFYETSYGLVYMARYLDPMIYWTDTSILNPQKITGQVTDVNGVPKVINFQAFGHSLYGTDLDGQYSLLVPAGWSGKIAPYRRNFVFDPAAMTIDNMHEDRVQNFTATYAALSYLVSGKITDSEGRPLQHVPLNGLPEYMETDENGVFTMALPAGWKGTVAPQSLQQDFTPSRYVIDGLGINREDLNFTGITRNTFIIQGRIRNAAGEPLAGVLLDGLPGEVKSDANGMFSVEVSKGWSGTIVSAMPGHTFFPAQLYVVSLDVDLMGLDISGDDEITGMPDEGPALTIRPYPNPSAGTFQIDLPAGNRGSQLTVYSMTGSSLMNHAIDREVTHHQFDIDHRGIFVVKLTVGSKVHVSKVVVR